MVTVACATLLAGVGSITPAGTVTVAWLTCVPTPAAVARSSKVTLLLAGRVRVPLNWDDDMVDTVSVPPLAPVALSSTRPSKPLGRESRTVAPVAALGPALATVKVKTVV